MNTTVYRIYGERSASIYIGLTDDLDRRLRDHAEKAWWPEVRRIETAEYAVRAEAADVEAAAIRAEAPKYNRAMNGDRAPKRLRVPTASATGKRQLVSIQQAAEYLGVCPRTIRRYIAESRLSAYRAGPRLIRVDQADLDSMLSPNWEAVS